MIREQRVNSGEIYIRFAGGQEYRRTRAQLTTMLAQEGNNRTRLQNRCITEIRALVGDAADQFQIIVAADGTPTALNWCDPATRTALESAGMLTRR